MEQLVMSKDYRGHMIEMLIEFDENDANPAHVQCRECNIHKHFEHIDFNSSETTMFLDAEFQMHATGVGEGWAPGLAFKEDNED